MDYCLKSVVIWLYLLLVGSEMVSVIRFESEMVWEIGLNLVGSNLMGMFSGFWSDSWLTKWASSEMGLVLKWTYFKMGQLKKLMGYLKINGPSKK